MGLSSTAAFDAVSLLNIILTLDQSTMRASGRRAELPILLAMAGIIAAAAVLRLYGLDRTSIWNDEAATWSMVRQPFWNMIQAQTGDNNPPLFDVILYPLIRLFGDSETTLRFPSAMIGIFNVWLIYRLGAVLWGRWTGVIAAALLAVSGFHIWYSQEARMYALFCATATAYALTTVVFLTAPSRSRAALCVVAGIALFYSHTFGPLNWFAINAVVGVALLMRARWIVADARTWLITQGLIGVSYLPWVAALLHQVHQVMQSFWIPFPTLSFMRWMLSLMAGGPEMLACLVLLVALSFIAVPEAEPVPQPGYRNPSFRRRLRLTSGWQHILLVTWAVVPALIAYVVSVLGQPILYGNYLIASLPPVLLLAARGLTTLSRNRLAFISAVVILIGCTIPAIYRDLVTNQREDFRAAVATFAQLYQNPDEVLFATPGARNSFNYYYREPVEHAAVMNRPGVNEAEVLAADRVWMFVRSGLGPLPPLFEQVQAHSTAPKIYNFYGVNLYLFERS